MIQPASVNRACLVLAVATIAAGSARADHVSLHGLVTGDVALTDNEFAVPSADDPEPDVYLQLRPGLLLTSEGPRMINEILAQAELLEYARHADEPTYSAFGTWVGILTPGPRSEMTFVVDGSTGKVNALTARTASDQTTIQVTPTGATDVRSADATESLGWQSTQETRTTETAFTRWSSTDDELAMPTTTSALEIGFSLGFQRTFHHDTIGIDAGGSYLRLERIAPPGDLEGSQLANQLNPRATVTWVRDLSQKWSMNLQAGIVYVNPVGVDPYAPTTATQGAQPYPIFSATVAYTDVWGHAVLTAARTVAPVLFIAQNTLSTSVIAQAAIPLDWFDESPRSHDPKLALVGSIGVSRSQLLDSETADTVGQFDIDHADVGFLWTPTPSQTYGLRYELIVQNGDVIAQTFEPSFYRDTLFFTFSLRYPGDVMPRMPRTGESLRSDRSDVAPAGAEQVVPDAAEPAPGNAP